MGGLIGTYGRATEYAHPDLHVPQTERLQIDDHRLSISCAVVELPDHQCGDDLVLNISETTKASKFRPSIALDSLYIFTGNDVASYFRSAANRINVFILGRLLENGSTDSEEVAVLETAIQGFIFFCVAC